MTDNWFWNVEIVFMGIDFVLIKSTEWNWIAKLNSFYGEVLKFFRWSYIVMYLLYLFVLWKIDVLFLNMVCKEISLNSIFKGNWKSLKTIQIAWNCLNIHVYGFVLIEDLNFVFFLFSSMKNIWNSDVWSRLSICCFIQMPRTETLAWKIEVTWLWLLQ